MHRVRHVMLATGIVAAALPAVWAAGMSPASAATAPYRNWAQAHGNVAGIKWCPSGDRFRVWDNVRDSYGAYGFVSYRSGVRSCPSNAGSASSYRALGPVTDRAVTFTYNVKEHTQICFFVEGHKASRYYRSRVVRYRTS